MGLAHLLISSRVPSSMLLDGGLSLIVMTLRRMSRAAVYTDYCTRYVWRSRSILSALCCWMIARSSARGVHDSPAGRAVS